MKIDLLRLIAERLAAAGIATLRYDKRGIGRSSARPQGNLDAEERFFLWEHFVADAMAAHAALLRQNEIKPYATAFLGHSEGGLLALAATGAMGARRPYGLVLASTPGRKLADIVREQIARTAPAFVATADRIISSILDSGRVPADISPELQLVFPAYAGPFLKSALAFDPAAALARTDNACLLVHGGADAQVVPFADIQPLLDVLASAQGRQRGAGRAGGQPQSQARFEPDRSRLRRPAGAGRRSQARGVACLCPRRLIKSGKQRKPGATTWR